MLSSHLKLLILFKSYFHSKNSFKLLGIGGGCGFNQVSLMHTKKKEKQMKLINWFFQFRV